MAELAGLEGLEGLVGLGSPRSPTPPVVERSRRRRRHDDGRGVQGHRPRVAHGRQGELRGDPVAAAAGLTDVLGRQGDDADGPVLAEALVAASDAARRRRCCGRSRARSSPSPAPRRRARAVCTTKVRPLLAVVEARAGPPPTLGHTPEQLPVLAQAGVVDAGGSGYLLLLDARSNVDRRATDPLRPRRPGSGRTRQPPPPHCPHAGPGSEGPGGRDDLRYEVMYLLEAPEDTIARVQGRVGRARRLHRRRGGGGSLWNCHIHTDDVGAAIEAALRRRAPEEHPGDRPGRAGRRGALGPRGRRVPGPAEDTGPVPRTAVVAVANGDGIARIFRSLGVHHFVPGGQSMNPSTAQILDVVESVPFARGGAAAEQREHPTRGDAGRASWRASR